MTTATKERPVLFSGPMVRAILDGRKTQTRRVLKKQPELWDTKVGKRWAYPLRDGTQQDIEADGHGRVLAECPFGKPGDRLWVREAWRPYREGGERGVDLLDGVQYRSDATIRECGTTAQFLRVWDLDRKTLWRPSIHMPRWASRISLEVTTVRVERLQAISEEDAVAEGAQVRPGCYGYQSRLPGWAMDWARIGTHSRSLRRLLEARDLSLGAARLAFGSYWNACAKDASAWCANPWVWVVEFRKVEA